MKVFWRNGRSRIAALLLLMGASCPFARSQEPPSTPPSAQQPTPSLTVQSIRIVTESGNVLEKAPVPLPILEGQPLDRDKVAASIRALFKSGDYADIRAVTEPVAGGVLLDFVVKENLYFNQITILGLKPPPTEASAAAATQVQLGQVYRVETLDDAVRRLKTILQEEGLYEAKVTFDTVPHPETHQMDIVVHIEPGPRATIRAIQLTNNTEYADQEILSKLKNVKPGKPIQSARLQRGTERIRKYLVKKGHLSGRAAMRRGEYEETTNSAPLTLDVSAGPLVRVEVQGAGFSKGDLRRLLPIYQEGAVDTDLLEEGKRNLREKLERDGYFDAKVSFTTAENQVLKKGATSEETEQLITYTVERGDRHKLVGIDISGNKYFGTDILEERLQIYAAAFASKGRFSRKLLENDRQSMENLYLANGFQNVKVEAQIADNYEKKEGNLYVKFVVQEGEQTRVASLKIDGNKTFTEDDILGVVASSPGQPYSDFNVGTDRANILALYYNEGFPEADIQTTCAYVGNANATAPEQNAGGPIGPSTVCDPDDANADHKVALMYRIVEGPQTRVNRVLIAGYKHTRPGSIRRQVSVKEHEPLRAAEVVDTQRKLYNLGIFNRVTVAPQNPTGTDPNKDVVVLVEEAKRYTIAYGGGFEVQRLASTTDPTGGEIQAAPRGIFEISKLNLTGRGDSLSLKLRGSTLQGRALLAYSAPNTFASPKFSFQSTAYFEKTQDINTFSESRYEASVQLTHQYSARTTLLYRYSFRKVIVSNLNIPQEEIPLFQQPTLVSQFGMSWVRDSRDNPADATKGTLNTADLGVADTYFGSSASFLRFTYQNASYYPIKRRFSFARSIRIGILDPYRDTVSLGFPTENVDPLARLIPLPERFFGGGGTSLRGFALNQAGPRDSTTGFPVGGQALLVLNQEFRFPMRLPWIGSRLGGTLFYDGGNVYSRASRITLRWSPPKPVFDPANPGVCQFNCTNELNYFSHTVGFGIRYATPVGPIRVDLGYQLNRPSFVIPCKDGTPNCQQGTRLPGFQVFFNLGSSF